MIKKLNLLINSKPSKSVVVENFDYNNEIPLENELKYFISNFDGKN